MRSSCLHGIIVIIIILFPPIENDHSFKGAPRKSESHILYIGNKLLLCSILYNKLLSSWFRLTTKTTKRMHGSLLVLNVYI